MPGYDNYLDMPPTSFGRLLQIRRARLEWRAIRASHTPIERVAEIGPGHGVFAGVVIGDHCRHIGLEANHRIAQQLRARGQWVSECRVPPVPLAAGSIDVVYASHVIEHARGPAEALALVQEAWRVLRPCGLLALAAPDYRAFGKLFWDVDYTHTFPVTDRRMQQLLRDGGFEIVKLAHYVGPFPGLDGAVVGLLARGLPINLPIVPSRWRRRLFNLRVTLMRNIFVIARNSAL